MKWTTLSSILFCAADFVTAVTILGICSYNITVTSSREERLPVPLMETWRAYLTQLTPIMAYIIVISALSCWGVTRKRKPCIAFMVVSLHSIGVIVCSVYLQLVVKLESVPPISNVSMKNQTVQIFVNYQKTHSDNPHWIPAWLVRVENESVDCCGILGYKDYADFWHLYPKELPESCCRSGDGGGGERKCITSLDLVNWSEDEHPSDFIKTEQGCWPQVHSKMSQRVQETIKLIVIMLAFLSLSLVVFSFQYIREFCVSTQDFLLLMGSSKDNDAENGSGGPGLLSVGEIWARMGFGKNSRKRREARRRCGTGDKDDSDAYAVENVEKTRKKSVVRFTDDNDNDNEDDDDEDLDEATSGSYTDIYLKQIQTVQKSFQQSSSSSNQAAQQKQRPPPPLPPPVIYSFSPQNDTNYPVYRPTTTPLPNNEVKSGQTGRTYSKLGPVSAPTTTSTDTDNGDDDDDKERRSPFKFYRKRRRRRQN